MKKILSKMFGKALKGKKGKLILLAALLFMLPLFSVASGAVAAWSYVANLAASIFGDGFNSSKADKVDISKYTLEELIDVADDKDIITDEALKNMMLDRESYKNLLTAIQKKNTEYDTSTKTTIYSTDCQ